MESKGRILPDLAFAQERENPKLVFPVFFPLHDPYALAIVFCQGGDREQDRFRGQGPGRRDRESLAVPGAYADGLFLGAADYDLRMTITIDIHARQAVDLGEGGVGD